MQHVIKIQYFRQNKTKKKAYATGGWKWKKKTTTTNKQLLYFHFFSSFFKNFLQLYCPNRISPMGNSGCPPREKSAATESHYPA